MNVQAPIWDLYINPTYAVMLPWRERSKNSFSHAQRENMKNLKQNEHAGKLSPKAIRRLSNSVNWLVASAKTKYVYDKETNRRYSFLVNFVTLTLPTTDHTITDNHFKKVMLHGFINQCRYHFGLKNFVWKVEAQENGNIHAHFTTDTFMHWKDVRRIWNKILDKNGLIDAYEKKHKNLSFEQYAEIYDPLKKVDQQKLKQRFLNGQADGWRNPNSTDVHAVHKVKDVAAYLAKYMGKKEEDKRPIKGKLWGCSQNLSQSNKLTIHLAGHDDLYILDDLFKPEIDYKQITIEDKLTGQPFPIGEMFFYKLSDWGTKIKGELLRRYNQHRFTIRHGLDFEAMKEYISEVIPINPKKVVVDCPF